MIVFAAAGLALFGVIRLRDMNLTVWQFLPTGPTAYGDSPYQPLSTFAGNEMLVDMTDDVADLVLDNNRAQTLALMIARTQSLAMVNVHARYLDLLVHTASLGAMAGVLTVVGAFVLAYANRYHGDTSTRVSVRVGTLGYALPGSVLPSGTTHRVTREVR